jgi:hypothetical protein
MKIDQTLLEAIEESQIYEDLTKYGWGPSDIIHYILFHGLLFDVRHPRKFDELWDRYSPPLAVTGLGTD